MSLRQLLSIIVTLVGLAIPAQAQKIIYVRANGNDAASGLSESSANATIEGAVKHAEAGDIVEIGPGAFEGATIPFSLTLKGANSGADITRWTEPTMMKSTLKLAGSDNPIELTCDGITFGQIVPVAGKSSNAIVSLANCMFNVSKTISTEGLDWSELVVVGCLFKGKIKDVSTVADRALNVQGVSVAYLAESYYNGYAQEAIHIDGVTRLLKLQYNEFTDCNSSGAANRAAIMFSLAGQDAEVEIQKNLITNCKHGIQTSGNVAGKLISVQYNKFVRIPTQYTAITHIGTGPLNATCNAIELPKTDAKPDKGALRDAFVRLFNGQIDAFPLNDNAEDVDGSAVGFEPDKAHCTFTK
jgi:hypothetical protein